MTWTTVTKPTTRTWTSTNPPGRTQYDQSSITYDDPNMFYDGVDPNAWTMVSKPTGNVNVTIFPGMATGLITPPTYSIQRNISSDNWTRVPKPII